MDAKFGHNRYDDRQDKHHLQRHAKRSDVMRRKFLKIRMADAMEMMILSILSPALHCEWWLDSWQLALITTVVFCGMMLSSTMWGNITDKYGRKTELIMCTVVTFYYGLISSLAPNFMWLLILRGLAGFGIGGVPQSVTLYAEYLPSAHRAKCVVLIEVRLSLTTEHLYVEILKSPMLQCIRLPKANLSFWAIGACFEVLLALFVMPTLGWRWLLALSSLPMLIFTCCCVWLPESARFHVASGHPELAMATLKRVAEENGRPMLEGKLVENGAQDVQRGRFLDLFLPESRRTTLTLWFIWMTNAFSYYGIVLFTTELFQSGDECHGGGDMRVEPQCPLECRQLSTKDYMDLLWTTLAEFPAVGIVGCFFCGHKFCVPQLRVGCGSHNFILLCGSAKMRNQKTAMGTTKTRIHPRIADPNATT
uniref:Major facilitator superfamily (MFS) profile domain-containing protein n=1 Tax=Romanomermis culicivorax TaxID=13658 RepID=A0A915KSU4_ROMCU